jgi:cysteine-rich repeat protein
MNSCKADCTNNVCGDGKVGPGEGCDDGNQNDGDECTNDCALATCGDGKVAPTEQCDDGNQDDTDAVHRRLHQRGLQRRLRAGATARSATTGSTTPTTPPAPPSARTTSAATASSTTRGEGDRGVRQRRRERPGQGLQRDAAAQRLRRRRPGPRTSSATTATTPPATAARPAASSRSAATTIVDPGEACDDGKNGDNDDGCTDACSLPACGDGLRAAEPRRGVRPGRRTTATAAPAPRCARTRSAATA